MRAVQMLAPPVEPSIPKLLLPVPYSPWRISEGVFNRLISNGAYYKCELLPSDPEYNFVYKYFYNNSPTNRHIKRVFCIHNPSQNNAFESSIPDMEKEAKNPVFSPKWPASGDHIAERTATINRFASTCSQIGEFIVIEWQNKRNDVFSHAKVLPLWHGSNEAKSESICTS